jgi:hypothetical protein
VEVLVVGGGGSGSYWGFQNAWPNPSYGGGGGGGGFYYMNAYPVTGGSGVEISVGPGGAASNTGNPGGSSGFDALIAYGGNNGPLGSGGASGANNQGAAGCAGGEKSGGGGGAGQAGQGPWYAAPNNNGGNGLPCSITGTSRYYGGGGSSFYNGAEGGLGGGGSTYDDNQDPHVADPNGVDGLGGGGAGGRNVLSEVGKGGSGIVILAYRAPSTPAAPVITGVTAGNGTLSVAFTAPGSDGGSAISNYKYSTNNGATFTAVSPAATTSPIVISGLTNGTAYTVRILAVNSVGDGAPSAGVLGTPVGNYASWAAAHGLSGGPTAVGNTGIPNLLLYALNLNPNGSNGSPGTLTGSVLSYSKRAEAVANGDVHYAIEESDDLGLTDPWTEVTAYTTNDATTISYTLQEGKGRIFVRLAARQVP